MGTPAIEWQGQGVGQPAQHLFLITPSDTTYLHYVTRAIRVGSAGDVAVLTSGGETITIANCQDGEILPVMAVKVYSTNTTATDLMGLA